jgi:hypothetical protein
MLSTFSNIGSILIKSSGIITDPYKFYDSNLNELQYFPSTSSFISSESLAGAGSGINQSGNIMIFGRTTSSTSTGLIIYSNDGGLNWYYASHPSTTAIGSLYMRESYALSSASPAAGVQPFYCDNLNVPNATFTTITSGLSAANRGLACANNVTSSTGYAYFGYQGFFKYSNNAGINSTVTMSANAYVGGCTDFDIDPDNPTYLIISTTTTTTNQNLYVVTPTYGKIALIINVNALILSVTTCGNLSNCIIQTSTATYRITNINFQTGVCTITLLSNGTILPNNVGVGVIATQSCKSNMSYNGNVVCVLDMNNSTKNGYLSTDGGNSFININTTFNLSNIIFVSCAVSRGGGTNINYVVLQSTTGIYRLTLTSQY